MTTWLALVVTVMALAGCGGKLGARVSGTVTLDGRPLENGLVTFHPQDKGPPAYGSIRSNGLYQLQTGKQSGLPPGTYRVVVVANAPMSPDNPLALPPIISPEKYSRVATTDLIFEVKAGGQEIPLELHSP